MDVLLPQVPPDADPALIERRAAITQLSRKWHNQHGSEVDVQVSEDGRVIGKFYSGTGLAKGEPCDLVGFATESLIGFTVDFSRYESVTSWAGHFVAERDGLVIHARWTMSVASPKPNDPELSRKGGLDRLRLRFTEGRPSRRHETVPRRPSHPMPQWP
jgi:hypothetical protein